MAENTPKDGVREQLCILAIYEGGVERAEVSTSCWRVYEKGKLCGVACLNAAACWHSEDVFHIARKISPPSTAAKTGKISFSTNFSNFSRRFWISAGALTSMSHLTLSVTL